jgi:hypothetical protein
VVDEQESAVLFGTRELPGGPVDATLTLLDRAVDERLVASVYVVPFVGEDESNLHSLWTLVSSRISGIVGGMPSTGGRSMDRSLASLSNLRGGCGWELVAGVACDVCE